MSLRKAAEAVLADHDRFGAGHSRSCSHCVVIDDLRSALAEPDELAEAREIIRRLLNFKDIHRDHSLVECARAFLKRTEGT